MTMLTDVGNTFLNYLKQYNFISQNHMSITRLVIKLNKYRNEYFISTLPIYGIISSFEDRHDQDLSLVRFVKN